MSRFRVNVLANLLGQGWTALTQLVVVPVYLNLMGLEAYGLIGFYVTLQTTIQVLDLGLGQTLNRELARRSSLQEHGHDARDLVRTVEIIYWVLILAAFCILLFAAPVISNHVIKAYSLSRDAIQQALALMALLVPLQLGVNLYQGGLMGLEKQMLVNALRVGFTTAGAAGALLVLSYVSPSIVAFFAWQAFVTLLYLGVVALSLHRHLPPQKARFQPQILRRIWRFAAGMSGITVVSILATQIDKWILLELLTLKDFGYYSLATAVAGSLYLLISPIFGALFPRFSSLVSTGSRNRLIALYHAGSQLMASTVLPAALFLSLFSGPVLAVWTRNSEIAARAAPIVSILVLGTGVNGLMNLPYALQLAHGRTRLALGINIVAIVVTLPLLVLLTVKFGPVGAALAWMTFNVLIGILSVPLTHKWILGDQAEGWVTKDLLPTLVATTVVLGGGKLLVPSSLAPALQVILAAALCIVAVMASGWGSAEIRRSVLLQFGKH